MPVAAGDLASIEAAIHTDGAVVKLGDGEELLVKVARPKANGGRGVRSISGILAADGSTPIQCNEHDNDKASKWSDLSKSGHRVTWVLVGKFPHRAAIPMVGGILSKEVALLPGAVVKEPPMVEGAAKAKAKTKGKIALKAALECDDPKLGSEAEATLPSEDAVEEPPLKKAKIDLTAETISTLRSINKDTEEFWKLEEIFAASVHGRNEDYNANRLSKKQKPLSFVLVEAEAIENPVLASRYESRRQLISESREQKEARERHAFHGTHPSRLKSLCDKGLLPYGHPLNPAKDPVDSGYFGSCRKGVYVSRYADYTLKYANRLIPLRPEERCRIVLFRCVPGLSKHIEKLCGPIDPTTGFDSHSSPQFLEWFLFNADQCCPSHVLTVEAREDTRTASDDQ